MVNVDFEAIAGVAFEDLLLLRESAGQRRGQCQQEARHALDRYERDSDTLPALQDTLVRLDLLSRAETMARTQDLGCHLLHALESP